MKKSRVGWATCNVLPDIVVLICGTLRSFLLSLNNEQQLDPMTRSRHDPRAGRLMSNHREHKDNEIHPSGRATSSAIEVRSDKHLLATTWVSCAVWGTKSCSWWERCIAWINLRDDNRAALFHDGSTWSNRCRLVHCCMFSLHFRHVTWCFRKWCRWPRALHSGHQPKSPKQQAK